jgi:hypothetical protein
MLRRAVRLAFPLSAFRGAGVLLAVALAAPSLASAQEVAYDIPAHVTAVDGSALIERTGGQDTLETNLTLVEGDRVRTEDGRVEILFADGTLLHMDRDTVIDFQREDYVRVMEGRIRVSIPRDARDYIRLDTPAATLEIDPGGEYRVAVAPNGDAELAIFSGAGALLNDQGETRLAAGERAVAALGRAPSQAFYANAAAWDDFDRWSDAQRRSHASAVSVQYLPDELRPYGSVFDSYGTWRVHAEYGRVWYPVAGAGWQPYSQGRWHSYPRYGWTWIGRDPWAWPTHHFGRWGFSAGVWFWIPGRSWGPAWVSWARSPGYVGWSPLGWNNRPIYAYAGRYGSNRYSSSYPWCGWTFIRDQHFGGRWGSGAQIHGAGIDIVARNGFSESRVSPVAPRRAVPRNGVAGGRAVPRSGGSTGFGGGISTRGRAAVPRSGVAAQPGTGTRSRTAVPRSGATMGSGTSGGGRSLGSVRTARPGSRPSGTIRSAQPRDGRSAASPRSGASTRSSSPLSSGRAVRRPSGSESSLESGGGDNRSGDNRRGAVRRTEPRADGGSQPSYGSRSRAAQPRSESYSQPSYGSRSRSSEPRNESYSSPSYGSRSRTAEPRRESYSQPSPGGSSRTAEPRGSSRASQPRASTPSAGGGSSGRSRVAQPRGGSRPSSGGGNRRRPGGQGN